MRNVITGTIDHMRCSPPMRPAALYHGIGTRGGYVAMPRPFGLGNAARVHRPTAPPASRLSSLEADSTAWAGPVRPRAGRLDRTRSTDSADRVPAGPDAVCRFGRPGSADSAGAGRCHRRQLPTRPGQGPLQAPGSGPGRRPLRQVPAAPRSAAN